MNVFKFSREAKSIVKLLPKSLISMKVFLWTYPISIGLAVTFAPENFSSFKDSLGWLFIGFAAHTAMLPFVIYARKVEKIPEQIFLLLAMGFTRGSALVLLPPILNLQDSLTPLARLANSTVAVFYWFQTGSIIVQYGSAFKSRIKELVKEVLEKKIVDMPSAARSTSNELMAIIGYVHERIIETVGSSPSKDEILKASKEIDSLINDHLRPLSQSTWRDGELTWIRAGFFAVLRRTLTSNKIPVAGVILLTLPFSVLTQSSRVGLISSLVVLTIWILMTLVADRLIYGNLKESDYLKANLKFLIAVVFFAYPATFFFQLMLPITRDGSIAVMVFGYVISIITQLGLFIASTLLVALYDDQAFAFEFLRDLIKRGELQEFLARTKEGSNDEHFAQYVHAEVQSQLLACKLLLLRAAESDFDLFPPEITAQILERMEKINKPYEKPVSRIPALRVEELKMSWHGLAEISHDLPIELSEITPNGDVISQLIEEAVVNAIRHGAASRIFISAVKRPNAVEVTVYDNGNLKEESDGKSGLGSILFSTFAKSWSRERRDGETLVTFLVEDLIAGS